MSAKDNTDPDDETVELLERKTSKTDSVRVDTEEVNKSWEQGTVRYSVRSVEWQSEHKPTVQSRRSIEDRDCKIHGIYKLPAGYEFAYVPSDAVVEPTTRDGHIEIASSYSMT